MVRLTLIARVRDGLPLAEGLDADKEHEMYSYKSQAKVGRLGTTSRRGQSECCSAAPIMCRCISRTLRRSCAAAVPAPCAVRLASGPPLAATPAPQGIFKKMAASSSKPPPRMSIESGPFTFHYLVDAGDVCYLTLTEKAYPKKLAFQYLEELASEFSRLYADQIEGVTRPYAFIKFGARPQLGRWDRGAPCVARLGLEVMSAGVPPLLLPSCRVVSPG